jgi:hypothetical protein
MIDGDLADGLPVVVVGDFNAGALRDSASVSECSVASKAVLISMVVVLMADKSFS